MQEEREDQEEAVGAPRPARLGRRSLRQCSSKTLWSDQLQVPRLKVTSPGDPCPTGRGWHQHPCVLSPGTIMVVHTAGWPQKLVFNSSRHS